MKVIAIVYAFLLFCFGMYFIHLQNKRTVPRYEHTALRDSDAHHSSKDETPNDTGVQLYE